MQFPVKMGWGINQSCLGVKFDKTSATSQTEVDLVDRLPKADLHRALVHDQLLSGHMRIDMGSSMTRGNLIVFKGERKTGKTAVALATAKEFLKEPNTKVVYISM